MWAELRKTYETTEEDNAYFDNYKYLARVRRKHPGWSWPGVNNGRWRPPLTQPSDELIPELEPGTKFTVTNILYQAVSGGMKYQAVEALIDNSDGRYVQSKIDKTGFIWIWHKDKKYFKEVEKKKEEKEEEETEWIRHDLKDEEIIKGFTPDWQKKYKLVFPVFKLRLNKDTDPVNEHDKFTLYAKEGTDPNAKILYQETLTIKNDKIERDDKDNFIDLHFVGVPRNLKYAIEVEPGPDENGDKEPKYYILEYTDSI